MVAHSRAQVRADRLRPLNVPRAVQVVLSDQSELGQPTVVIVGNRRFVVDVIRESWEIDDEWWRKRIARRYFDVVLKGGKHVVLFVNTLEHTWYMQDP
jgi:hypothetical protein